MKFPICFVLLVSCALAARADENSGDIEKGRRLLKEGDGLADQGDTTEAVLRYKQAFEQILPAMRHLPFRHEVKRDVTAREALQDFLLQELDEEMTPEAFHANEQGMKALGFLDRGVDLKPLMLKVYSEEIAAFYDPRTKTMHLIKESDVVKPLTFLQKLMGKKGGFDKAENQTVIAHELTHALADQHFDLKAMQEAVQNDDDQSLALSALIEGEATLTMMGAQMADFTGEKIGKLPSEDLDTTFGILGAFLPMAGGESLRNAPPILRESLIFPYLRGLVFCARLTNDGDWAGIDEAYRHPPVSTEQVLHPRKYRLQPDPPMAIALPTLEPGESWKEVGQNVVGEFQTAILLRKVDGRKAAAGWDGDRFAVFEGAEGELGLVWVSTWDSEDDAQEFAESYARFQTAKVGDDAPELGDEIPETLRRDRDGASFVVDRRGADVVIVEGFPAEATDRLLEAARQAEKTEKRSALDKPEVEEAKP